MGNQTADDNRTAEAEGRRPRMGRIVECVEIREIAYSPSRERRFY